MLHGDTEYYYDLAVRHDPIVHAFIAYSRRMYDELLARLPHRAATIFHLPYGIPLPAAVRRPGRRTAPDDLCRPLRAPAKRRVRPPEIDRLLHARGVDVQWSIAGAGPDEAELRRRWAFNPRVQWLGRLSTPELLEAYTAQDVFVLPTRFEGFPGRARSKRWAPGSCRWSATSIVVSRDRRERAIGASVRQRVISRDSRTRSFSSIVNRTRLEAMSAAARQTVEDRYDIRDRVAGYQALYARWEELYRPVAGAAHLQYGSRLDHRWIPNPLVRLVRTALARTR
jgi:hypothetical protein